MCCGGNMKDHHDGGKDCCFGHEVVKDRICCKFTITNALNPQDVYVNNTGQCIMASGTISLGCSLGVVPGDVTATVTFFNGGTEVGLPITIGEESCVSFTAARFTRISVQVNGLVAPERISGKICITPRYQLHV